MVKMLPLIGAIIAFISTLIITPKIVAFFKRIGLTVEDVHRIGKPLIPRGAGLPVWIGLFISISLITLFINDGLLIIQLLIFLCVSGFIMLTGFFDDLVVFKDKVGGKKFESGSRLKQWQKPLFVIPAIFLFLLGVLDTTVSFPIIGKIDFGNYYLLFLVPLGVIGAANMVNMLEGLNGLGAGIGLVYTGMLGAYALVHGKTIGAIIALSTFGTLVGIWWFVKFPAKIHAGDSLTYLLGSVLAAIAIFGKMEIEAIICSIPFFIELILKARGRFKKETIGYVDNQGFLHSKYERVYSLPHIWMRTGRYTEKQIVYFLMLIELFFSSLIWLL